MLNFEANGITLNGGMPSVVLLVGKDEQRVEFTPAQEGTKTQGTRSTPLGLIHEENFLWCDPRGYTLTWSVGRFKYRSGFVLRGKFYNGSAEPVRLREIVLCQTPKNAVKVEGDPEAWLLSSLTYSTRVGTLGQRLPSANEFTKTFCEGLGIPVPDPLPADEKKSDWHWRDYANYLTLYTDKGKKGWVLGTAGTPRADLRFDCRVEGAEMTLIATSDMTDVVVAPGQCREAQDLLILAEPYATGVESMLHWNAVTYGRRTHRRPFFGWCSWYDLHGEITAESVSGLVDAVGRLKNQIPFQTIQIDCGYERRPGDWRCNSKFPEGMEPLVKKMQAIGVTPGIWLAPLAVHDSLPLFKDHPDWLQRDAKGQLLGEFGHWGPKTFWLDPSHPAVKGFIRQMIRDARNEGFSYFKIDFNAIHGECRFYDSSKTRLEVYRDLYKLYREEIGEAGYLLACSLFFPGVFGYADASRIGYDSEPHWREKHWCCISECIRNLGMSAIANGVLFDHDPDVTYSRLRGSLTEAELRTWHGFVGLLGGTAMISEPLQSPEYSTPEALRRVEILNPPSPERGRSFYAATDPEHTQFGFDSLRSWGNSASILLWNPADQPASRILDTEELGAVGEQFHLWSFWDEQYLGVGQDGFSTGPLPPHGSALLRLTALPAKEDLPVLVGSTLHISMGSAEIADLAATPQRMVIRLTDAGARAGKLFIFSKGTLNLESAEGCRVESITAGPANIWTVSLCERDRAQTQILRLRVK